MERVFFCVLFLLCRVSLCQQNELFVRICCLSTPDIDTRISNAQAYSVTKKVHVSKLSRDILSDT